MAGTVNRWELYPAGTRVAFEGCDLLPSCDAEIVDFRIDKRLIPEYLIRCPSLLRGIEFWVPYSYLRPIRKMPGKLFLELRE